MDGLDAVGETAGAAALELAVSAMRARGAEIRACANCQAPVFAAYCDVCGQPIETHRHSVLELARDFVTDIASFDSRILRTAYALMMRPGELPLAFREGRTQRYVPPVRLYLFVSLIFFVALSLTGIAVMQMRLTHTSSRAVFDKNHDVYLIKDGTRSPMRGFKSDDKGNVYMSVPGVGRKPVHGFKADGSTNNTIATEPHFFAPIGSIKGERPEDAKVLADDFRELDKESQRNEGFESWLNGHVARMLRALAINPASINGPLTEWIPRALIVLLPLYAMLLAGFYWRQRKTFYFVDHLVFSLNIHTLAFIMLLIAAGLAQLLPGKVVLWILAVWLGGYVLLSMKRYYGQSWLWTGVKFASTCLIYTSLFLAPAFGLIILATIIRM